MVTTEIIDNAGIGENSLLDFSIYPVPATDILTIRSKIDIVQIEIYDSLGQLIISAANQKNISITNLTQGLYFCKVMAENGDYGVRKIIIE